MLKKRYVLASVLALVAALHARAAHADDKPPPSEDAVREAAARYKLGTELYDEENYRAALIEFRKAYELTGEYRVLYNIGQICFQVHDYVCALTSFEMYLAQAGTDVAEKRRLQVQGDIEHLRPRVGVLTVTTSEPDVVIVIDDVPRGKTPLEPIMLSAGQHRVTAQKAGRVSAAQSVDVVGADTPSISFDMVDVLPPAAAVIPPRAAEPETPARWTTLSWVGLGASGVLATGAAITGILALSASNDLESTKYVGEPSGEATSLRSRVQTLRLASDILTVGAIATLGTTIVLTMTRRIGPAHAPVALTLSVKPGGASIAGAF